MEIEGLLNELEQALAGSVNAQSGLENTAEAQRLLAISNHVHTTATAILNTTENLKRDWMLSSSAAAAAIDGNGSSTGRTASIATATASTAGLAGRTAASVSNNVLS